MSSPALSSDAVPSSSGGASSGSSVTSSGQGIPGDIEAEAALAAVRCDICQNTYVLPKVLSCFHTYCYACLLRLQEAPDRILCPRCQTETYMSSAGLNGLMPDYGMINMISELELEGTSRVCGGCKVMKIGKGETGESPGTDGAVVAHCVDCRGFLCENCVLAHKFMHCFERHQVSDLTDQLPSPPFKSAKVIKCPRHVTENIDFFCRTCNVPICRECTVLEHPRGHAFYNVSDIANLEIDGMLRLAKEATQKSIDLRLASKNVEHSTVYLHQQYQKAKNAINETFEFYCMALEERRKSVLQELDSAYNDKQVMLSTTAQEMHKIIGKSSNACDFINKLVVHSSHTETLICKNMIESKLKSIIDYIPDAGGNCPNAYDLEFSSCQQNIQAAVRNSFGVVKQTRNGPTAYRRPSFPNNIPPYQIYNNLVTASNAVSMSPLLPATPLAASSQQSFDYDGSTLCGGSVAGSFAGGVSHWNGGGENGSNGNTDGDVFSNAGMFMGGSSKPKSSGGEVTPPKSSLPRTKMVYNNKFGEFGSNDGQFTEPSGVAMNSSGDILVADTNNHRVQIFDRNGEFKFQFGQVGKREGQLLYPNRVAVCKVTGNIVITERSPTHQVQIFTPDGQFIRKFGSTKLQHPRGVAVDMMGRIIVVECKVMRVIIFDSNGIELGKFGCSKHLEFPNGVVVNDQEEIFISDNRSHCVKVFSYSGNYLRQIGGEGLTNYPIGVGINSLGEVLIADNHNNFNVTVFKQDGELVAALESRIKHAQCFDVALGEDGTIVLASRDFRVYIYHYEGSRPSSLVSVSSIGSAPASSIGSVPNFLLPQQADFSSWFQTKLTV